MDYLRSGPMLVMVLEGANVVKISRQIIGLTNPNEPELGTIRGDFCIMKDRNIIHGAKNVLDAKKEMAIWFDNNELCSKNKETRREAFKCY